jgi:hypothetical protein
MNREVHVRFCEGLGVQLLWATHLPTVADVCNASAADMWRWRTGDGQQSAPEPTHASSNPTKPAPDRYGDR